jgi:hypothetical protein
MATVAGTTVERTLFTWLVWIGLLMNWAVAALALLHPGWLVATLGLGPLQDRVWIVNYAVLLALIGTFYIPAARDPDRYRANAWLLVVCRLVPAAVFFSGTASGLMPAGFTAMGIADAALGAAALVLIARISGNAPGELRRGDPAR